MWLRLLMPPGNWKRYIGLGLMDMLPMMQDIVRKYDLHWNERIRLVAFDVERLLPVVFQMAAQGERVRVVVEAKVVRIYVRSQQHLATALASSCCVCGPGMMRPIAFSLDGLDFLLVDGGFYNPQPGDLTDSDTAVVGKLIDLPFVFADRERDFAVDLADPFEPLFSALSATDVRRMQQSGYRRTRSALRTPILSGLIPAVRPHVLNPA
jgi:predicted acylesterase/phospholipase RssA